MGWRIRAVVTVVVSFGLASAVAEVFRGVGAAEVRREAVRAGVAEWVAVPETGEVVFRWLVPSGGVR